MKESIDKPFDYIYKTSLSDLNPLELEILRLNQVILTFIEASEALKSISVHSSFTEIAEHRYVMNSIKNKVLWQL